MATAQVTYTATGGEDTYAFSFAYLSTDHVKLYLDGVEDTSATFPTASSIQASAGNPAASTVVLVKRETPRTSLLTTIANSGSIRNSDLNNQSLQSLYVAEEARDVLDNTMSTDAAGVYWDAVTKKISNVVDPAAAQDAATKNYVDTGADSQVAAAAASAAAALVSENNAATSESNASTSASNASTSASNASTSASNAATSETNAGISETNAAASAAAASTSETNAGTSETNAAASASAASTSASNASTSETNAATSESNASTSASNASTSASNAATSETNASNSAASAATEVTYAAQWADRAEDLLIDVAAGGNGTTDYSALHHAAKASASASAASTSESNAATSESNASTSASNAATSESNAATSATNASNAQTAAEAAQAAAEAAADNFDDTYLGSKTSDPTLDNDGDPLTTGDLYFNTTNNDLMVYNGSAWEVAAVSTAGLPTLAGANVWTNTNRFGATVTIDDASTGDGILEVGGTGGNKNAYIDLIGDSTYSDYGLRVIRTNGGANAASKIEHRGTGTFTLSAQEAGAISLTVSGTEAIGIDSNQTSTVKGVKTVADDDGNQSSGTYTPSPNGGNIKRITNTGTFAIGPPSENCTMVLEMYNDTGAGTVTFSAFTYTDGDSFTTTVGHWFLIYITRCGSTVYANVKALQ